MQFMEHLCSILHKFNWQCVRDPSTLARASRMYTSRHVWVSHLLMSSCTIFDGQNYADMAIILYPVIRTVDAWKYLAYPGHPPLHILYTGCRIWCILSNLLSLGGSIREGYDTEGKLSKHSIKGWMEYEWWWKMGWPTKF